MPWLNLVILLQSMVILFHLQTVFSLSGTGLSQYVSAQYPDIPIVTFKPHLEEIIKSSSSNLFIVFLLISNIRSLQINLLEPCNCRQSLVLPY